MGKFLDYTKKKKREEEESSSSSGGGNFLKYTMEKTIGLDTFESDLADMGNTIGEIYSGWQTPETMANTKVAVESMQNRVNKYDEYKKMYGVGSNLDLDNLKSGYQTVLDDWDKLTQTYGAFKDAESYKNYPNYQKSLKEEQKKKDERVKALDNSFDQYKYYEEMDDFEERSQYKSTIENKKFLWMDDRYIGDEVYEYINNADGKIRGELLAQHDKYQANAPIYTPSKYAEMGLDYLTEEEKRVFNVIYTDSKESAYKFLDDMKTTLLRRGEEQKNKAIKESVDDNFLGSAALSIASVPMSIGGGIYSGIESITGLITGEDNPYSVYHGVANESSSIRQNVGEEIEEHTEGVIGSDVFGQNIYRFLYDTGMSMADSAMGIAGFGKAFTPIMGMNAYQQKYKEMIEGGEDQETAQSMALASGVAETLFEHLSVEKLFNIKNVDGWKKGIKAAFAQAGFEGSEELFTELANVISDDVIRGEGSDFKSQYNELVARGYSEEEAKAEIRNQFISQLGWAFAGGALSGLGMGGLDAKYQYNILTETGKDIRANDRASEMINVASDANMTAQESETYKLYTEYANNAKGDINADNISDAQLGNLYATAKNETYDTLNSKKATPQQKFDAERRVSGLAEVETKKTEAEKSRPDRLKALETGEVTEVKATGNSTSIEGFRTENGETFVQTGEGEFKTSEMTFTTKDAELLSYAEGMGDVKGNLFLSQYDGTANIDDYAKSFNLVHAYGESGFGHQNALALKGVLSERQAFEVYSNAMLNKAAKDQKVLEGVFKDGKVKIDESVIDYTNSGKGEVNWNELTPSQRKSVHVAKVYANALGVDLTFFNTKAENDVYKGKQGAYYGDGVLHVDIQAGRNTVMDHNSYIVPVMSHELTHHLERTSPKAYAKLQDHVMNTLVMHNGGTVHDLIETERSNLAGKRGVDVSEISEELAISELVARSCEDMLSNSKKAKEFLSEFTESERNTFVGKVKEMYHNLIKWIDNVLKKLDPKTNEAKAFREHKAEFEKLLELWDEALVEMKANQKNADNVVNGETLVNGISKDGTTIVGENVVQMSERTYDEGGRDYLQNWLKKKVKSKFITQEDADDILKQTDAMYDLMQDIKNEHELPDYARWAATDVTTDENGKKVSVIVKNGDYSMNLDIALVCKKRTALNAVLNAMVQSNDLSVYTLTETDVSELNAIIKKHEFEIACALCFVDSKRYRVGSWAESFCEGSETKEGKKYGFNEMVRSLVPKGSNIKIDEFNFTGRDIANQPTENLLKDADDSELDFTLIDQIMKDNPPAKNGAVTAQYRYAKAIKSNPELRSILNPSEIISSIGLDAIRVENTLLYGLINGHQGTAKPKFAHQSVAFKNDILRATSWNANKAKKVGGVRLQSFSDFMANMVFDYAQMISEMAAKKLPAHAYTKEPLFVKLFGLTGMKINMSLVPRVDITEEQKARFKTLTDAQKETDEEYNRMKETAGLRINKNGEAEYVWEDETFPYDVAMDIMADKRYTKNCGTICVGISNAHINKLLADERISMVIPYHKSGLNHMVAEMRNIALYNDYTNVQNTRYASGEKLDPKKHKDFDFYGDLYGTKSKPGTHDPKQTAENYKKWCAEHNYLPKFDYFKDNPNYYKLLIDFSVYDINDNMRYTEQEAVKPIYPSNEEFKDLIVNGVVKNGVTYGGLKQAQVNASRLNAETKEIINEFRNRLTEKYGEDVLGQAQFSDRVTEDDEYIANGKNYGNALDYLKDKLINGVEGKDFITVYRSFQVINGGLYAPMNAVDRDDDGKNHRLGFRSRIGVIEKATESPAIAQAYMDKHPDAPYAKFNLDGVDNSTSGVAYNPYLHASNLVMNDQFSAAYRRNLVTVECRVPISEIGAYKAQYAKDPTGWVEWKPGGTSLNLAKAKPQYTRKLFVSRYMLPYRILDYSEVANMYKEYLDGTDIKVPWNVVGSDLREALLDVGIGIDYKDYVVKNKNHGDKVYTYNEHKDDSHLDLRTIEGFSKNAHYAAKTISKNLTPGETENTIYIKDGHTKDGKTVNFIDLILDGKKKGETRSHKSLTRKWVGIAKDGLVYGRVRFGDPIEITNKSPEYKDAYIEGTEYGLKDGESKYYYPVLEIEDMRDNPRPITRHGNYGQYQYSDRDSDGNTLTAEQMEYFKDSKARDAEGNLLVVYHGTRSGGFNEFSHDAIGSATDYGYLGRGFYFTGRESVAKYYAGYLNSSEVKKGYVNVTNPIILPDKRDLAYYMESLMESGSFDILYEEDANYERSIAFTKWLKDNGYDGVICKDEIMVLDSNQFKNIDNTNPTEDADIRYSDRVFEEAEKVFGTTKVFEEVGYILPDGKMLKFTDKNNPGKRMYDHRAIAMAYGAKVDLNTNYGFSFENGKYLDDFVENGGIRFDSGNPDLATDVGLQLSSKIPLTKEQERVIRDLVEWKKHREETYLATTSEDDRWLYRPLAIRIAFGGDSNNGGGSDSIRRLNEKGVQYLSYEGGNINASRIINDIRKYYQTGEINEQSNVAMFHYSDRYEDTFFDLFDSDGTFAESSAIIEEDVNRLKQRLSMGASSMSLENIKMIAKHLLQKADSRYDFEELTDDIKDIFEYIRTSKDLDSNALIAKCKDVASRILADQNEEKVSRDYAKMVLREIRSEKISTSKEQLEGIKDRYGDKYNNAIIGRIPRSNNGVSLDSKWAEWSQKYPGIFDANIESKDMLTELDDIVKAMQSASEARHAFEEAVDTTSLGAEIYNQMWLRSTTDVKTDADKQRLKELNFAHRKAIDNVRNNLTNRQIDSMRMVQIIDNLKQKNKADVKKAKELGKERMDKYRDMVERKAKIEQISKTALTLNDWMRKPSNEKHIHDEMQPVVSYLLNAIDFSSKRLLNKGVETKKDISLQKALSDLQNATKDMRLSEDAIYALYGENLDEDVKKLVDSVNNTMRTVGDNHYILNQMSLEELETLCKVVKSIKHSVTQMNHFHVVNHSKGIINLGQEFINHAKKYGQIKLHKHGNDARFTLNWGNALPFFTMKRFGEAGVKVRNALMDGQDKLAFNADKIIKYAEKTYTSKECKEWSEDIKTIEILLPAKNGQPSEKKTIQIPVSHIMSLYCLSKREHALGHLSGGGIRIVDFETKNGVVSQSEGILLMGSELNKIVGKLTKRQIEVADALQKFMNEDCSDWGNEISMARFGYKAFTEKNYFPIASDKTVTGDGSVKDNEKSLYRLLNMSFAKPLTEKANNRIEVDNIFDVFAKHTSEMAKYNAMALPVLDAVRWFAYHEKGEKVDSHFKTESVRQAMEKAYGKDAVTYVRTLLEDINGADNVGRDKIAKGFMSKAKIASVGFNLKVVALQPTSYLRARAVIDGKYLIKAKTRKPKIDMAEKWCGIAKWKSFGFYDINIQRGLADLIKHDASLKDRITDASMKGAEWADKFTLGYLWNACEYEVMDKRKDLVVGSDEFNTEVGKKLREVIYSTQVVDSTMTRSHMMRSGDTKDKILTNFASEPTLSYNMVLDCVYDWSLTKRETGSNSEGFKKYGKKFARTLYAYTVTSAITAALETAFSMFRDDDEEKDEEEIIKMYLESFALNMSIMNKIPYAKELISIAQGFRSSNMETQWMQYFTYAAKEAMKVIEGEGNAYKMTKNALQGASYLSGIPAYNFIRDAKSLWNLVVGSAIPSLKLKVD